MPESEGLIDGDEPPRTRQTIADLDRRLEAFEARGPRRGLGPLGVGQGAADGYRLLGQMLGGVLGGLGLGWLLDHFAHTGPWGVVGGLVIGAALSIIATVKTASAISARSAARARRAAVAGGGRRRRR